MKDVRTIDPIWMFWFCKFELTPETHKIKKVSFGDLYIFFNLLILRHHRISINVNLIQNNSFCEKCLFPEWTQVFGVDSNFQINAQSIFLEAMKAKWQNGKMKKIIFQNEPL